MAGSAGTAYVDIEAKLDEFANQIDAAVAAIDAPQVDIEPIVDTSTVTDDITAAADSATPVVTPDVDTGSLAEQVNEGVESADPAPIVPQVDTTEAKASVDDLSGSIDALADTAGLGGGAASNLTSHITELTGASAGATAGATALAAALAYSVSEAEEAQVVTAESDQLLANLGNTSTLTAAQLSDLAGEIQGYSGFSDEAVQSGENMLLSFRNVSAASAVQAGVFERTTKLGADLATRTGDVTSAITVLGRAIDDPEKGMSRLRRAGIQLTQAEQDNIKALQAQGDLLGAQQALLDAVDQRVGGLAETYGGTFAGQVDRAKEALGEMAEEVGRGILPILEHFSTATLNEVNALNQLSVSGVSAADVLFSGPLSAIAETGSKANDASKSFFVMADAEDHTASAGERLADAQGAASDAVSGFVPTLADAVTQVDKAGEAFGVLNASTDPTIVIDNLQKQIFAFLNFSNNLEKLPPEIATALAPLGPAVAGPFAAALASAPAETQQHLTAVLAQANAAGLNLEQILTGHATNAVHGAAGAITAGAPAVGNAGGQAGQAGAAHFASGIAGMSASATAAMVNAGRAVMVNAPTSSGYQAGLSTGQSFGRGLSDGIGSSLGAATGQAIRIIQQAQNAARNQAAAGDAFRIDRGESAARVAVLGTAASGETTSSVTHVNNITVNVAGHGDARALGEVVHDELRKLERAHR